MLRALLMGLIFTTDKLFLEKIWMYDGCPKGAGHTVRSTYRAGGGVPCLIAVSHDASGTARDVALSYACAIGEARQALLKLHLEMKPRQIYLVSRLFCVEGLLS